MKQQLICKNSVTNVDRTSGLIQEGMFWKMFMDPLHTFLGIGVRFMERLVRDVSLKDGDHILDIGCATGVLLNEFSKKGMRSNMNLHLYGIEPSAALYTKAKRNFQNHGVKALLEKAVMEQIPFSQSQFDIVTATFVLHHLPLLAKEQGLREVWRVLKSGGRIFIADISQPTNVYEKIWARLNYKIENISSNIHGEIPELLNLIGFSEVKIIKHYCSIFLGSIDIIQAKR